MEPLVASLRSSFRRVPPAAIPPMMDCILASTDASPSSLFYELLKGFPSLTEDIVQNSEKKESEWRNFVVAYVAAVSHLLKKSGANHMIHIHIFVWKMLIPLLKLVHTNDHELFNTVTSLFLDVVIETDSWEVLESTMVPLLLRSIGLSMGMFQSEDLALYKWSKTSISKGPTDKKIILKSSDDVHDKLTAELIPEDFLESDLHDFPLSISCNILTLTLEAAIQLQYKGVVSSSPSPNGCSANVFAGNILWDISNLTLQMLSQSLEHRSSAVRFLLPFIFKAFAHDYNFTVGAALVLKRKIFFMKIWKCCKLLFTMGSLERRDAYKVISLYLCYSSPANEPEDVDVGESVGSFDLRADQEFWDEIKKGLLDKESLLRKQSLHILKSTLNLRNERKSNSCVLEDVSDERGSNSRRMSKKERWADKEAQSLSIGRKCNVNESSFTGWSRWETFVFLYEILEEFGTHLVEAAWSHQIMLWLRSLENPVIINNEELYHNRMANAEQTFEWLAILWERGFCHDNPQVRCFIMQSFLEIEWENYGGCLKLVPRDFTLGPLILGLNDPVHHREFGVKEVYSSWAIETAAKFFGQYVNHMEGRQHIAFLIDLCNVPKTHSFGRVGLMCLVECIASAACGFLIHNEHEDKRFMDVATEEIVVEFAPASCQNKRADLLDVLRFVLECCKQHFNSKYRHQVCAKIITAAASAMTGINVPLNILLNFISSLPREYTDYGGSLRHVVQNWLRSPDFGILKAINEFPKNFISYQHPVDSFFTYDDEELETWISDAKRWARVLFLVVKDTEHFDSILKFVEDHGADACNHKNSIERVAVKFHILVSSMIEELQVTQGRPAMYPMTGRMGREIASPSVVDNLSFTEESITFDKLSTILFSFLEELVSFTKLSCSVFWRDVVTEQVILPGSIRGKLGGPSQRRLPSSLCTSVLEAITAIKTLASVLRWGAQFKRDDLTNSAQTFLWNFCLKVISTPAPKSEVEAEICIAAYEACAYALKDIVSVFSPSSLNLVANGDRLFALESEGKTLDVFVRKFIHNINKVIDEGSLARTRRAVLLNWKWSCLEYLLSLPNHALCNGVDLHICKLYFSDTTVKQIFGDLVGSLENAGEVSVLPMLRSVRLSMELFDLKRMDRSISSGDGISIEMMWLLVRSSWILHVSCNKRRVASIAALLSSVLHYSVFRDECMHEYDNVHGPLKWFVGKILEEGTKSPRTIRLAALHLCGLWLAYPNTIKYYINELKLLTFYGSVAFDEDFEAELAENYDARTEVSVLSRSLDPELTDVFINTELYARVSVSVLFGKLADLAYSNKSTARDEDKFAVIASGKIFLLELLNSVVNDKDLSKELIKKYSAIHRRKVRAWQMICVLSRFVDLDIVEQVTSSLHTSIYRNNFPSVRQYLETFAIFIYLKFPSLVGEQLVSQLRNCDLRTQALSSYVFIAANVILNAKRETKFGHLDELLPPIVPLLTSHHHTLRGITQILVYRVLENLLPASNSCASASMSLEQRCFVDLKHYLAHNSDCAKLRASMDSYLDSFDPLKSVSPAGIFTNRVKDLEFECVPMTLMERVIDFLNVTREGLRYSMAKDAAAVDNEIIQMEGDLKCSDALSSNGGQSVIHPEKELIYDFQRKINFSKNEMQDSGSKAFMDTNTSYGSLLENMENEDQLLDQLMRSRGMIFEKLKSGRQQIILLASLVDRIPNLAGLARTCEVFRAAGLAVADKNILNDKQFQLISVTAEKWVPVVEVPVASMKTFLEKKKREGFAILGLEQTANSFPLDQYKFSTKTVLVLGREKEGIPVELIHMLDACVEIPQLGVVRSLNVHVSGAIALWEYTRQQRQLLPQ